MPKNSDESIVSSERSLTLFPRNPFFNRNEWAKELDIELFDPVENTARVFDAAKLPFRTVRNAAALNDPTQKGILIVGEDTSLLKHRSLAKTAIKAASAGRRVVMLAPANGAMDFPGSDKQFRTTPNELRFAQQHIIREFDKRLDARAWFGTNNAIPSRRLNVESLRGRVEISVADQDGAWPWLEVRFPQTNGVFIVCGFQMIQYWDNGPTPRYLFLRILESLDKRRNAHIPKY